MCLCVLTVVSSLSFPVYLSPFSLSLSLSGSVQCGLSARLLKEPSLGVLAALSVPPADLSLSLSLGQSSGGLSARLLKEPPLRSWLLSSVPVSAICARASFAPLTPVPQRADGVCS